MKSMKDLKQMFVPDHIEEIIVTKGFAEPMISVEGYIGWTFQQITDWLREEKGIHVFVMQTVAGNWACNVVSVVGFTICFDIQSTVYYSALQSGIEKSLELI
jgi:hypothetical protein